MVSVIFIGSYVIRDILYFSESTPEGTEKIKKVGSFCEFIKSLAYYQVSAEIL